MVNQAMQQRRLQLQLAEQAMAQQMAQSNEQSAWDKIGGLIGSALAKRSDGVNDKIGEDLRYTNDGAKEAFNDKQIADLQAFAQNGMDTSKAYGNLANTKFTLNDKQYQADKNGLLTQITPQAQQQSIGSISNYNINTNGLSATIPSATNGVGTVGLDWDKNNILKNYIGRV